MAERNRRVERQMQADFERLKPRPVVAEWMENLKNDPEWQEMGLALEKDGVRGLEPYIAERRVTALSAAKEGDMAELSGLVRNDTILNADEREFVADWLIGAVPTRRGAPQKSDLSRRVALAHFWLTEVDGYKVEAVLADLHDQFGLGRTAIRDRLKSGQECIVTQEKINQYRLLRKLEYFDVLNHFKKIDLKSG